MGLAAVAIIAVAVWQLTPSEFKGTANAEASSEIPIPFEEFRTIMVRNSPTRAIIEHGGMQLVSEEVMDIQLDLTKDRRPLINALLRQSKSDVSSRKRIVVALDNADIHAKNLELLQDAEITPEAMTVFTSSLEPAGDLTLYHTTLHAQPNGDATSVRVSTEIEINKKLARLFHGTAKSQLEASTKEAVQEQITALEDFSRDNAKR